MPARGTMRCGECWQFRPRADFRAPNGLPLGMCRSCTLANMELVVAARIRRYDITALDYEAMRLDQDYRCAVCKTRATLHVDHCHVTNKVRGLLCRLCNTGMGMFKDDADLLQAAADYITYGP